MKTEYCFDNPDLCEYDCGDRCCFIVMRDAVGKCWDCWPEVPYVEPEWVATAPKKVKRRMRKRGS